MKNLNTPQPLPIYVGVDMSEYNSHRERDSNYSNVIVIFNSRWRLSLCRDGIQWILQQKEISHGMPWRGVKYFRSKEALLRVCGSLNLLSDEYNRYIIEALPEHIIDVAKK
jgi:hypothetical protein